MQFPLNHTSVFLELKYQVTLTYPYRDIEHKYRDRNHIAHISTPHIVKKKGLGGHTSSSTAVLAALFSIFTVRSVFRKPEALLPPCTRTRPYPRGPDTDGAKVTSSDEISALRRIRLPSFDYW